MKEKARWIMNFMCRTIFVLGLCSLLAGCVTPTDMGYVVPAEPVYTTPVYNTSPAYYATPVSGYSTMTVYDGYHPGYGGPRYPHHRPPPRPAYRHGHGHGHGDRGHGGHGVHGGHGAPAKPAGGGRVSPGGPKRVPVNQGKPPSRRPAPSRGPSNRGGGSGKGGGRKK